ncbi:amidohydrolase [Syntrophomonas erecta]
MIAVKGGTIHTLDNQGTITGKTIFIDKGRIVSINDNQTIPDNYQVINAVSQHIFPGFIDAHTHLGLEEEINPVEGDDLNEFTDPVTPQLRALDGVNLFDPGFTDALRGGVTRVMSMPGSANIIGGQAVFLKTWAEHETNMVYRPSWGLKAALGENPKRVYAEQKKTPVTRMANASLLREALYKAGRTMGKTIDPAEEYKQEPIFRVLRREMPLLVHAHRADDILTAIRIKDEFNIELIIQHGTEAFKVADELVRKNIPVFLGPLLVNRAKVEMKEVSLKNARRLAERGVQFSFITDHPVIPIEHIRVMAALAVREGLDEEVALQALTTRPASALHVDHEIGSIKPGNRADIVAFDGHPFEFRSQVQWAMVDGCIWRGEIDKGE